MSPSRSKYLSASLCGLRALAAWELPGGRGGPRLTQEHIQKQASGKRRAMGRESLVGSRRGRITSASPRKRRRGSGADGQGVRPGARARACRYPW